VIFKVEDEDGRERVTEDEERLSIQSDSTLIIQIVNHFVMSKHQLNMACCQ